MQLVAYHLDGDEVIFRTTVGSPFAVATRHSVIAFQVDRIDPISGAGGSVVGVGETSPVTDPARLATFSQRLPVARLLCT